MTYQRISTPDRDYLFPTLASLIADKAASQPSVIKTEKPKIIEHKE